MPALLRRIAQVPTSVSETHARSEFDRFGPLKRVPIRTPPKKDRLEKLRELREMLKSGNLSPDQIRSLMRFRPNLTMFEAVALAEKEGTLIVPNGVHDRIFNETDVKYSVWTGTLIIYEAPTWPFSDSVTSQGLTFQIPREHRGRRNCALVIEHPDFTFIEISKGQYEVKLAEGAVVHLITHFPKFSGWCTKDRFDIPCEYTTSESPEPRELWRADSSYIGLLVRADDNNDDRWAVCADYRERDQFSVALIG